MKILVCVKIIAGGVNPFDESALECALRLSDDVTVLSMGPESTKGVLQPLTRLGAKVVLVSDKLFAGSDTLATSYILSVAAKQIGFDLILCGRQSTDGDTAQVGPMLSARLGIPLLANVLSVENLIAATRQGECQIPTPALLTVERSYYLRFPSIFSKPGEVKLLSNRDLGCDEACCGLKGSPTRVLDTFESRSGRRKCKFMEMDALLPLIERLKMKAAQKAVPAAAAERLQTVWAVGERAAEKAREIAENVVILSKCDAQTVAERAKREQPAVILWNADAEGRIQASLAAAMLETGLCADCTRLEADGGELIMYRPARGGNVIAKIKCLTRPQMATVRCRTDSADILVSGGRGVAEHYDRLAAFAASIGAELCASRGLVDMGKAPYTAQIGLTGRMVSPRIYIAVGISGAVQHTCAIEGAGTVIAINPDKNARIFDYADYGIITEF